MVVPNQAFKLRQQQQLQQQQQQSSSVVAPVAAQSAVRAAPTYPAAASTAGSSSGSVVGGSVVGLDDHVERQLDHLARCAATPEAARLASHRAFFHRNPHLWGEASVALSRVPLPTIWAQLLATLERQEGEARARAEQNRNSDKHALSSRVSDHDVGQLSSSSPIQHSPLQASW